jgi:hypothetical protein
MIRTALVEQHLQQGERILWSAGVVEEFYRGSMSSRLKARLCLLVFSVAGAVYLGFMLADLLQPETPPAACGTGCAATFPPMDILKPFKAPFCITILIVVVAFACVQLVHVLALRRASPHSPTDWFAVTSRRLLELDRSGALLDQVEKAEITRLKLTHRDDQQILIVHRERKHIELAPFKIAFVKHPAEAKAIIEKELLEQPK